MLGAPPPAAPLMLAPPPPAAPVQRRGRAQSQSRLRLTNGRLGYQGGRRSTYRRRRHSRGRK